MAVNVFRDTTFHNILSSWWDGSQTPATLAEVVAEKTGKQSKEVGQREIVKESDTGTWYTWQASIVASERGWYDSDGTKKA